MMKLRSHECIISQENKELHCVSPHNKCPKPTQELKGIFNFSCIKR